MTVSIFQPGVNLERFKAFIEAEDWDGMDAFLHDFQMAVEALLYCDAPVVGAPSGLALGGGYEVLAHCDHVVAHTNSVLGLVETVVGVVPGGGGVKETYLRWHQRTDSWDEAAFNTFNQIGYGQTGTSPNLSSALAYFEPDRDTQVMNRDRLVEAALSELAKLREGYQPRPKPSFTLAGSTAHQKALDLLNKGREKGWFYPHDVTVASEVSWIVTGGEGAEPQEVSERDMYAREREAFLRLAKTPETYARISGMLSGAGVPRN